MNMILFSNMPYLPAKLSHLLIPKGIPLFNGASLDELNFCKGLKYNICLIDDSCFFRKDIMTVVTSLRKNELKKGKKLILISTLSDKESMRVFTIMGFDLVIPHALPVDKIAEQITLFIEKNALLNEQRKYLRFKVSPDEVAQVNLFGNAKITDISMGGIAVTVQKEPAMLKSDIEENKTYNQTQIMLQNQSLFADLKLIKTDLIQNQATQGTAVFQFQQMDENSKNHLAEYIFYKTQETYLGFRPGL